MSGDPERHIWQRDMLDRVEGTPDDDLYRDCKLAAYDADPMSEYAPGECRNLIRCDCPGCVVERSTDLEVERRLEEAHFDVGEDSYGDWFSGP